MKPKQTLESTFSPANKSESDNPNTNDAERLDKENQVIVSLGSQVQLLEEEIDSKNEIIMGLKKEIKVLDSKSSQHKPEMARLQTELDKKDDEIRVLQVKEGDWDIMASKRANEISELMLANFKLQQKVTTHAAEKEQLHQTINELERKLACSLVPEQSSTVIEPKGDLKDPAKSSNSNNIVKKDPPPRLPDVIFFHDSLGKPINKTISAREGLITKKIQTARLHKVQEEIDKMPASSAPRLFVIHVGTNDLHYDTVDDILDKYVKLVSSIHEKFPQAKVLVSHIVIRNDNESLHLMLDLINASLSIEFADNNQIKVCRHLNIGVEHLKKRDGVHLTDAGTVNLSKNLRYAVANCLNVKLR